MAVGEVQEDVRGYGDVKPGLPVLQLPPGNPSSGFFGAHLPLGPPDSRQHQYLDTRPETQHQFQASLGAPLDSLPPAFHSLNFHEPQQRMQTPIRRTSRISVSLTIHGLEDPSTADLEWSLSAGITADQRARIDRHVRKVLSDPNGSDSRFTTPTRGRSCDASRGSSATPDQINSNYRFVSQHGRRRPAEYQLNREDEDTDEMEGSLIEVPPTVQIRLGDEQQVLAYYDDVFKGIQQLALKSVLKEWIKKIEPKKQKKFSYKTQVRPKWWPQDAKYKEPDHIKLDDRIKVAVAIVRHAQKPDELEGVGLAKLKDIVDKMELRQEGEKDDKVHYRRQLLENLFALARAEQQVKEDEKEPNEALTLPQVRKYEKPNKKRKRSAHKSSNMDSSLDAATNSALISGWAHDNKSRSLLEPATLRSQGERASSAPTTPQWSRHVATDSGISFPPSSSQSHNPQMTSYAQPCDQSIPVNARYSEYDGTGLVGPDASPDSVYSTSTATSGAMHMTLSYEPTSQANLAYNGSCRAIADMHSQENSMMTGMNMSSHAQPLTQVYPAVTEPTTRSWAATPASYMPSNPQTYTTTSFY